MKNYIKHISVEVKRAQDRLVRQKERLLHSKNEKREYHRSRIDEKKAEVNLLQIDRDIAKLLQQRRQIQEKSSIEDNHIYNELIKYMDRFK